MHTKVSEKEKAVRLRKQGKTYAEILEEVPVAKSTLSIWLQDTQLGKKQLQRITKKRMQAQLRGAAAQRSKKEKTIKEIKTVARGDVGRLSKRERWLIGTALYWAEGSKEKSYAPGSGLKFTNSDAGMVKFYIEWLEEICGIPRERIQLSLYAHETNRPMIERMKDFWTSHLGFPRGSLTMVYFKKNKILTTRKNIYDLYNGTIRVTVLRSSTLNRKVAGWVEGIVGTE